MPLISGSVRARISGTGSRRVPWIALVFVGIVAQLVWMDATVGTYDEGLVLVGADRVLRGDIPYRDFWTLYGPGSFYLLAGLFRLFGELVLVERGLDIAAKTAIATLIVALVLQFGRRAVALAAGVLSLGLLLYLRSYSAPLFPAMAGSLATVLALHRASTDARPTPAFLAGVALGFTTCFRHDLGAYTLLASGVYMIQLAWDESTGPRRARVLATAGWVAAGYAVSLGPVAGLLRLQRTGRRALSRFREYPVLGLPASAGPAVSVDRGRARERSAGTLARSSSARWSSTFLSS